MQPSRVERVLQRNQQFPDSAMGDVGVKPMRTRGNLQRTCKNFRVRLTNTQTFDEPYASEALMRTDFDIDDNVTRQPCASAARGRNTMRWKKHCFC
jgi:hypothetical protein